MKNIGGEMELQEDKLFHYLTDSGRSSLRLILRSIGKGKKILLPDFLCEVIVDVVREFKMDYAFYTIGNHLTPCLKSLECDILYVIDYFGERNPFLHAKHFFSDVTIIEDGVFLPNLQPPRRIKKWIGFNSFRKISYLSDGSLIKSTIPLQERMISSEGAKFPELKYQAKQMKYEYIKSKKWSELQYLNCFKRAEFLLDKQKKIFSISKKSLFNLLKFYSNLGQEYLNRQKNYRKLDYFLRHLRLGSRKPDFPCFYTIFAERRDELREYLFSRRIFLPVHWPRINGIENELYQHELSIPVDSRYQEKDMIDIANLILKFYH